MLKKDIKFILGCIRRADQDFGMIKAGDRVLVGLSGGKDSLMLVHMMDLYRQFSPDKFELVAATLDLGLKKLDFDALAGFCRVRNIPYVVEKTNIGEVVFEARQEKNPCALCAKMRRGSLATLAQKLGCNKIALGHQREDVMETLLLSLFHEGRINTFAPVTWLDRSDIEQIRPMIYVPTKRILPVVRELAFPVQQSACPAAGDIDRERMRNLVQSLNRIQPNADEMLFRAIAHPESYGLWDRLHRRPEDLPDTRQRPELSALFPEWAASQEKNQEENAENPPAESCHTD